jgi:hypothetical protein
MKLIALMMEALSSSETDSIYQTIRRNIPEDSHLLYVLKLTPRRNIIETERRQQKLTDCTAAGLHIFPGVVWGKRDNLTMYNFLKIIILQHHMMP